MPKQVDWCELPEELLLVILKRLPLIDYLRLGAVCSAWRSTTSKKLCPPAPQLPWLMHLDNDDPQAKALNFYSLPYHQFYKLDISDFSHPRKRWIGCSSGRLMIMYENYEIYVVNPISKYKIRLLPATTLPKSLWVDTFPCIVKAVLLPPDDNGDYTIFAICGTWKSLAYCKSGDKKWSVLQNLGNYYHDIIYYKGKFYGVSRNGTVIGCDLSSAIPQVTRIAQFGGRVLGTKYLVESQGDFLLVSCEGRSNFTVLKLEEGENRWIRVDSLGDQALFLGPSESMSLSVTEFSQCEKNSIYYAADFGLRIELGIYHLENGRSQTYSHSNSSILYPPAIWFMPNPW